MGEPRQSSETEKWEKYWLVVDMPQSIRQTNFSYLHCAVFQNRSDILKDCFRLFGNINLNELDVYNRTVFHIAATHGHYECLKVLCSKCSDKEILNARDCCRYTALHYAVQNSNTYCAKLLLETGADPNSTQHSGCTSLHLAAVYGFSETVMLLCEYGADVHAQNFYGETPLLMAARSAIRVQERMKVQSRGSAGREN